MFVIECKNMIILVENFEIVDTSKGGKSQLMILKIGLILINYEKVLVPSIPDIYRQIKL